MKGVSGLLDRCPSSFQAAIIRYHRLESLSNRNLFLIAPEAGKSKIRVPPDLVSNEIFPAVSL